MPVHYSRTSWYGLSYLTKLKGSLFIPVLPSMLFAATLSALTCYGYVDMVFYGCRANATCPPTIHESQFVALLADTDVRARHTLARSARAALACKLTRSDARPRARRRTCCSCTAWSSAT